MTAIIRRLVPATVAGALALWASCSNGLSVADGTNTSETTNGVMVSIHLSDGTPVPGAVVRLRPRDYLAGDTLPRIAGFASGSDTLSGTNGHACLDSIHPGRYVLDVRSGDSVGRAEEVLIPDHQTTVDLGGLPLTKLGAVHSTVAFEQQSLADSIEIRVRGIETLAKATSGDNASLILPAGSWIMHVSSTNRLVSPREIVIDTLEPADSIQTDPVILAVIDSTLSGYWTFDTLDGTTVIDSSARANHGTLLGGALITGTRGAGLDCGVDSGKVTIQSPADGSLDFADGQDFSLAAWFRLATPPQVAENSQRIISKRVPGKIGYSLQVTLEGKPSFRIQPTEASQYHLESSFDRNVADNQWHHVAGIRQEDNLFLYLDGSPVDTVTWGAQRLDLTNSGPVVIGGESQSPQNHFEGAIDQVRIYRRALSQQEVSELYSNRK